jgi:hypothetical protein
VTHVYQRCCSLDQFHVSSEIRRYSLGHTFQPRSPCQIQKYTKPSVERWRIECRMFQVTGLNAVRPSEGPIQTTAA